MLAATWITILVSWTFNHTGGSLIPVFLVHCAFNFIGNATGIFASTPLFWLLAALGSVVAIVVIILDRARFTRPASTSTEGIWKIQ